MLATHTKGCNETGRLYQATDQSRKPGWLGLACETSYRPVLSAMVDSSQVVAPPTLQLPSVNNVVKVASSLAAPGAELEARNNTRVSSGA